MKKTYSNKTYKQSGYNIIQRVLSNLDKCSKNSQSKVVRSPWGTFRMYKSNEHGRFYSVSGSNIMHNGGGYKIGSIRSRLTKIG
jgi:hypothetical protein